MSTSDKICKEGASKSNEDDGLCDVNDMLQNMSTADNNVVCANCGKEGSSDNMNTCNKCKQVKYCNAVCKKVHKKKHKKECEEHIRLETERAAELHDIELFKQPPLEDCPICFLLLPSLDPTGKKYKTCCGKMICSGCYYAPVYDNQGNEVDNKKCAFCRTPHAKTDKESVERTYKRVEKDDPFAIFNLGIYYRDGIYGFPQDDTKALELYHRAAEHGLSKAYVVIGYAYDHGEGVEVDKKKAKHYYELAAMRGNVNARYNLGLEEGDAGNMNRALKHHMIAVRSGFADSLKIIKFLYSDGHATKEDYMKALQLYQAYLDEIKSDQRDKAAAYNKEEYRYY